MLLDSLTPSVPPPSRHSMPEWALELEARLLTNQPRATDRFWLDPSKIMTEAGLTPDPWQTTLLRSTSLRRLLLCSRQAGKSTAAAALALQTALLEAPALVLLLSPSLRQSSELLRKVTNQYHAIGRPVGTEQESALRLELANGSRIVSLPGSEGTVRGYSGVSLLVIDEASRVPDALYYSVRPMLAVSRGRLVALSTPVGRQGWFFREWSGIAAWERVKITAEQCPRISREFLAEERLALGQRWYDMEYGCEFQAAIGAVFDPESIAATAADDLQPLFLDTTP
jgi:hypothetical protein